MVETEDFRSRYEGDSSNNEFPFGFYVTNKSQVRVVKTGTDGIDLPDLVVDVDYSVGGVANSDSSTWKITYPISGTKLAPSEFVTIVPNYDLTQLTPFRTQGSFFPQLHENAFDYLTRIAQMQQEQLDRTVKVSVGSTTDPDDLISDLQTAEANAAASASAAAASAAAATAAAAMSSAMPLWLTAVAYSVGAVVRYTDEKIYRCATAHTSGTFATDLAAVKWVELSGPSALTQAQVYDTPQYAVTSGTDTYTTTLSPVPSAYISGMRVTLKFGNANTGAATINLNSLGAKTIQLNGAALSAGDLPANSTANLIYDGTNFQLAGIAKPATSSIAHTDWTNYTPTIGGGFGTATSISGRYRKVGSSLEVIAEWLNGTVSAAAGTISIPGGFTIVNNGPQFVGVCADTTQIPDGLVYNDGTTVKTNFNANSYHTSSGQCQARFTCEVS